MLREEDPSHPSFGQEAQDLLPLKYKSRESTDLKAEVTDSGGSGFDFDLTD